MSVKKTSSLGCHALNLLPPNIFPSSGGPSRSRTQTYGTNHLSICISLFCSIFRPLPIQQLVALPRMPRRAIIAYGVGLAIPLLPHIVRRRQLHRPTLHPNKSTLVLPAACVFPRSGSFGLRSRRRPPPWCSRRSAAVCHSQHGQQNKRNREMTVHREADSPGPTRSMA